MKQYQFKVWSGAEKRASAWGRRGDATAHCSPFDYDGKEIAFTISKDVPLVNLGTIRLLAIEHK